MSCARWATRHSPASIMAAPTTWIVWVWSNL